ncbi:MAG: site-specific integrase, partial [Phycisphaerae bacterium]|nr:site-specific integrase [Phycisphaerae bacterium]
MTRKSKSQRPKGMGCLFKRSTNGLWIARWYDHAGRRRESSTRTTDRAAAERILANRIAGVALRKDGVIDARTDRFAEAERKILTTHLDDWKADLTAKGVTAEQVQLVQSRARKLIDTLKIERISEISASAVQTAIGELHVAGKSLQTCHHYLRAIKQFSRWLRRDGRTREDVLAHLEGYNAATDPRYERRALDADELAWLIRTAEAGPAQHGMNGPDRAMLYRVTVGTGFRASELRSLTPASFKLDDPQPTIVLDASKSKRRREDRQPIRSDLAELLRPWLIGKPADVSVFAAMPERTAEMIRADLQRARLAWIAEAHDRAEQRERQQSDFLADIDAAGRVADFHALRVTFITMLVKGGVPVKAAQELARHSTPTLTLGVYTKLGIHDLAGALTALPPLTNESPRQEAYRATGTDD